MGAARAPLPQRKDRFDSQKTSGLKIDAVPEHQRGQLIHGVPLAHHLSGRGRTGLHTLEASLALLAPWTARDRRAVTTYLQALLTADAFLLIKNQFRRDPCPNRDWGGVKFSGALLN